jgi:DNA segregation ATPase FtsK/SpoIIIE-like protein
LIKALLAGAAGVAFCAVATAGAAATRPEPPAWVITPEADGCRTELELTGASGAVVPVSLVSDGEAVDLVYARPESPERAFLPIRVDHRPFANLALRRADGKSAAMRLSPETLAALRKGGALQIGWLADEPVQATLAGSEQALADLKTCGAQAAVRFRDQQAAERETRARLDADTRAKAIADEQLAAAEAQRNTAEAERLRASAEAERQRSQAEAETARREAAQQARIESYDYPRSGYPEPGPAVDADPYGPPYDPRDPYPAAAPGPYRRW